jgi:hypothetical protein
MKKYNYKDDYSSQSEEEEYSNNSDDIHSEEDEKEEEEVKKTVDMITIMEITKNEDKVKGPKQKNKKPNKEVPKQKPKIKDISEIDFVVKEEKETEEVKEISAINFKLDIKEYLLMNFEKLKSNVTLYQLNNEYVEKYSYVISHLEYINNIRKKDKLPLITMVFESLKLRKI